MTRAPSIWPKLYPGVTLLPWEQSAGYNLLTRRIWHKEKDLFVGMIAGWMVAKQFKAEDLVVFYSPGDKWRIIGKKEAPVDRRKRYYEASRNAAGYKVWRGGTVAGKYAGQRHLTSKPE